MQNISTYSELALLSEVDSRKRVSIIQPMAKKDSNAGTQIQVRTYTANEDIVVPDDESIVSVDHDRSMAVTRVVTSRPYDAEQAQADRDAAAGPSASPTYPQPTGGVPERASDPSTSYEWGTLDVTKVQNVEAVKNAGPTIAEKEAAGKAQAEKDQTEVASELNTDALANSADPNPTPENPVDSANKEEAAAASQSPAQAEVHAENASTDEEK
jgi:hypothetical protein